MIPLCHWNTKDIKKSHFYVKVSLEYVGNFFTQLLNKYNFISYIAKSNLKAAGSSGVCPPNGIEKLRVPKSIFVYPLGK